mgnify:CR=1 FL=1
MGIRKGDGLHHNESWTYNGVVLDIVDEFNYLGTVLNYTCISSRNQDHLIGKAFKALCILTTNILKKMRLRPKLLCQLCDAFVGSILNYG